MSDRTDDRRRSGGRRAGDGQVPVPAAGRPSLVVCPHCGMSVPPGDFCGHCGAHLTTASVSRRHAFAAVPSEPVVHLSIISTLFPHLPHRQGGAFRWALIAGITLVAVAAALRLYAPATAAAAILLPALYLLYLYEVEVYEDEPWFLVAATMVAGGLLGFIFSAWTGGAVSRLNLAGDRGTAFLLAGVVIPLVAQALMLAGPLFLFLFRSRFREPLDGLTFGAASALGFTFATTLVNLWPLISGPLVGSDRPIEWALPLLRAAILSPLVNASATAVVTAAIWLQRYDRSRPRGAWQASVPATLVVSFGSQVLLGALSFVVPEGLIEVAMWALGSVALLLFMRLVIHQALLAEGSVHEIGPDAACPECHRIVPTMLFCPACGVARTATSKPARPPAGSAG
jgi:RsiW-degrading membrane proteinase PrsW (M82 family)/ribosomal protein L32